MHLKIRTEDNNFVLSFAPYDVEKALGIIKQLAQIQFPSQIIINDQGTLTIYIQGDPELDWKGLGVEIQNVTELLNVPSGEPVSAAN